jgi:hypothetical protein
MGNTNESSEGIKNLLVKRRKFLIVVAAFALLGAVLLSRSQAATFSTAIEAEDGTVTTPAGPGITAGASGDASVKFGLGGLNPNPNPPATGTEAAVKFNWGTPLAVSDEFNYGSASSPAEPDGSKWGLPAGGGCFAGHDGNGQRCGKNSRVDGEKLVMTGEAGGDTGWMAQELDTQYGRWEGRSRSQSTGDGDGQYHPLFLIWPSDENWPGSGEYDWLEYTDPDAQCLSAFIHYPHPNMPVQQEYSEKCPVDMTEWHNFGFEWTADHVKGYVDGEEWFSFSGGENSSRECIQCMPSGHINIQLDNFYGSGLQPAVFEVDWFRTYAVE